MTSRQEKAEQRRQEALELMRDQIQNGSLVIRQMTDDERRQNPPRPRKTVPGKRR
jgi:hypothetical protein